MSPSRGGGSARQQPPPSKVGLFFACSYKEDIIKILALIFSLTISMQCFAQVELTDNKLEVPQTVNDLDIQTRIENILKLTEWYPDLEVKVSDSVVVLEGSISSLDKKEWLVKLIEKTDGVIAYIDKTESDLPAVSVLKPARNEASEIYTKASKLLPYIASAILIFFLFLFLARAFKRLVISILNRRNTNALLVQSVASAIGIVVLILGLYFSLKASGLTTLSVTLLGGTGMLGLGLGLALKNTFENYISSIMISLRELLRMGELVNINGHEGVVQTVTSRGTTLMDYDGNNIIIPNTEVFNSVIKNYTRNPNMRAHFTVGIGYEDSIDLAREVILKVIEELSENLLSEPKPLVVVVGLGAATVNLKVFFWFETHKISKVKILSLVMQKTKEALIQNKISMPDDAREVVFASPLKIERLQTANRSDEQKPSARSVKTSPTVEKDHSQDLTSEIDDLKKQALLSPDAEKGKNLVKS